MKKTELSMETKKAILEDYNNPNIKAHDVHKKHGITQQVMQAVVLELGGKLRRPKINFKNSNRYKLCPNCHKKIEIKSARFCPFCASDIRSEKDILCEKIEYFLSFYAFLPEDERDNFNTTLLKIKSILNEGR